MNNMVLKNYIDSIIDDTDFQKMPIGNFAKVLGGYSFPSTEVSEIRTPNHLPLIKIGSLLNGSVTNDIGFVEKEYKKTNQILF